MWLLTCRVSQLSVVCTMVTWMLAFASLAAEVEQVDMPVEEGSRQKTPVDIIPTQLPDKTQPDHGKSYPDKANQLLFCVPTVTGFM